MDIGRQEKSMKKIVIRIENVKISASLNDTKAAEDLAARFPLKVKCTDIGGFYQGILARGLFDPLEYKKDAEVGDIAFQKGELLIRTGKEGNHDYKHPSLIPWLPTSSMRRKLLRMFWME